MYTNLRDNGNIVVDVAPLAPTRLPPPGSRAACEWHHKPFQRRRLATSRFADTGAPAELSISSHKPGNASDVAARDAGILVSLLLQFGCSPIRMAPLCAS
jgi:hypothetical protein